MNLLGNQNLRNQLASLALNNRLHHCLLFEGPEGVGKHTTALWLAQVLNCESLQEQQPCGRCWHCRSINDNEHPDLINIGLDPDRVAPIISVQQIRVLLKSLQTHTFRARWRVVVFDPASAMRKEAANAMLKTFEEPPSNTFFILICRSASQLIPTIRSRSQRIRFRPVQDQQLHNWLPSELTPEVQLTTSLSDGCPGKALDLLNGGLDEWKDQRAKLIHLIDASIEKRLAFSAEFGRQDRVVAAPRFAFLIEILQTLIRDVVLLKCSSNHQRLYNYDRIETLKKWASVADIPSLFELFELMQQIKEDLKIYVNIRLLLDNLLAHCNQVLQR